MAMTRDQREQQKKQSKEEKTAAIASQFIRRAQEEPKEKGDNVDEGLREYKESVDKGITEEENPIPEVPKETTSMPPKKKKKEETKNPKGAGRKKQKIGEFVKIHVDVPIEMQKLLLDEAEEKTGGNLTKLVNRILNEHYSKRP